MLCFSVLGEARNIFDCKCENYFGTKEILHLQCEEPVKFVFIFYFLKEKLRKTMSFHHRSLKKKKKKKILSEMLVSPKSYYRNRVNLS